ncbi:MAG: hypothetical protein ABIO40_09145 [Devosia sp.]
MRIVVTALLLALGATAASAEDLTDWTGFYAGLGIGVSQARVVNTYVDTSPSNVMAASDTGDNPFLLGEFSDPPLTAHPITGRHVLAGYLVQQGPLVVGVEADAVFGGPSTFFDPIIDCGDYEVCALAGARKQLQPLGHLRAIIGGVTPDQRLMGFAAVGIAAAKATNDFFALALTRDDVDEDHDVSTATLFGPSVGMGIEVKATDHLRLRAEGIVDIMNFAYSSNVYAEAGTLTGPPFLTDAAIVDVESSNVVRFTNLIARLSAIWQF